MPPVFSRVLGTIGQKTLFCTRTADIVMSNATVNPLDHSKRRLMVVDDHPVLRRGLANVLANELDAEVSAEAGEPDRALRDIAVFCPELVVVGIPLSGGDGIELIRQIRMRWPEIKVVAWSMFEEDVVAKQVAETGARGYVEKNEPLENMIRTVAGVLAHEP